ncbi:MAG: thioredoxin family protein [Verrucomicrobia bacterium]|nr:thioredoxin family protein [Verrucomicrobiota bacterium]
MKWILQISALATLLFAPLAAAELSRPVEVKLVSENLSVKPGESFYVGVHFQMQEGWHTYWKNPGDAGFAPQLEWNLPPGFKIKQVNWPYPSRFEQSSLVGFGYEESMTLLAEVIPPEAMAMEAIDLGLRVNYVACKDSCTPGSNQVNISIPVLATAPKADPQVASLFAKARSFLPQSLESVQVQKEGDQVVLHLKPANHQKIAKAYFFPDPEFAEGFDYSRAHELKATPAGLSLAIHADASKISQVSGVLVLADATGATAMAYQVEGAVMAALGGGAPLPVSTGVAFGFGVALFLAFLGGLILNLMPCVLPVISLKILSFVNMAGGNRKQIFEHGLFFTFGVLVSFWALAIVLLVLRAYGEGVGWGFQLQEPLFLAVLTMVIFALGLSLLGVFEFGTSLTTVGGKVQGKKGRMATFLSGVLATVVATPCTGPFLAPALGYAVTLSAGSALLVFTFIGLGMSLPYLLLAAFPQLLRKLPKPGPWMVVFKQAMGFLMLATVLWLLWVFQAEVDSSFGLVGLLFALLVLSVAAWIYGKWGTPIIARQRRYLAYGVTAVLVVFALMVGARVSSGGAQGHPVVASSSSEVVAGKWVAWDPVLFQQLREQNVPVFVDFTAKWCLICQANRVPLNTASVQERFVKEGVIMMEADWTKRDPVITAELEKFGRNGVPLYVLYGADQEPQVLPQMLTPGALFNALDEMQSVPK